MNPYMIARKPSLWQHLRASALLRLELSAVLGVLILLVYAAFVAAGQQRAIADKMIRLHIVAQSDSEEDQALKLAVRDRLMEAYFADLSDIQSASEAYGYFASRLDEIAATAEAELKARGCDRPVTVTLGEELYPDRHYDGFSLPAGEYTALRVAIGDAQGQNWWCVMFPPLCTSSAVMENLRSEAVFSDGEWRIITSQAPDVAIRFKLLEWWAYIKNLF